MKQAYRWHSFCIIRLNMRLKQAILFLRNLNNFVKSNKENRALVTELLINNSSITRQPHFSTLRKRQSIGRLVISSLGTVLSFSVCAAPQTNGYTGFSVDAALNLLTNASTNNYKLDGASAALTQSVPNLSAAAARQISSRSTNSFDNAIADIGEVFSKNFVISATDRNGLPLAQLADLNPSSADPLSGQFLNSDTRQVATGSILKADLNAGIIAQALYQMILQDLRQAEGGSKLNDSQIKTKLDEIVSSESNMSKFFDKHKEKLMQMFQNKVPSLDLLVSQTKSYHEAIKSGGILPDAYAQNGSLARSANSSSYVNNSGPNSGAAASNSPNYSETGLRLSSAGTIVAANNYANNSNSNVSISSGTSDLRSPASLSESYASNNEKESENKNSQSQEQQPGVEKYTQSANKYQDSGNDNKAENDAQFQRGPKPELTKKMAEGKDLTGQITDIFDKKAASIGSKSGSGITTTVVSNTEGKNPSTGDAIFKDSVSNTLPFGGDHGNANVGNNTTSGATAPSPAAPTTPTQVQNPEPATPKVVDSTQYAQRAWDSIFPDLAPTSNVDFIGPALPPPGYHDFLAQQSAPPFTSFLPVSGVENPLYSSAIPAPAPLTLSSGNERIPATQPVGDTGGGVGSSVGSGVHTSITSPPLTLASGVSHQGSGLQLGVKPSELEILTTNVSIGKIVRTEESLHKFKHNPNRTNQKTEICISPNEGLQSRINHLEQKKSLLLTAEQLAAELKSQPFCDQTESEIAKLIQRKEKILRPLALACYSYAALEFSKITNAQLSVYQNLREIPDNKITLQLVKDYYQNDYSKLETDSSITSLLKQITSPKPFANPSDEFKPYITGLASRLDNPERAMLRSNDDFLKTYFSAAGFTLDNGKKELAPFIKSNDPNCEKIRSKYNDYLLLLTYHIKQKHLQAKKQPNNASTPEAPQPTSSGSHNATKP